MTQRNSKHDNPMTIWEHISELRTRLLVFIVAVTGFSIVAHYFHDSIIAFLLRPLKDSELIFLTPLDPLLFIFKIDLMVGLIASVPILNWSIISFIRPATNKFSWTHFSVIYISVIFLILLALIYSLFVVAPISIGFLLSINVQGVTNMITASSYISFLLTQIFIIAVVFQIPLFMATTAHIGVLDPKAIAGKRRYIYLFGLVGLSILTPTSDVFNLAIVAVPALIIFEGGLIVARVILRFKKLKEKATQ